MMSADFSDELPPPDLRADLVRRCEMGVVAHDRWLDRDSARAQVQLATLRGLLLAGCPVELSNDPASDDSTTWVRVRFPGFGTVEWGSEWENELFYVPTHARLAEQAGRDWY
jgi:hypothetical protein